jgi:hypothetical protein
VKLHNDQPTVENPEVDVSPEQVSASLFCNQGATDMGWKGKFWRRRHRALRDDDRVHMFGLEAKADHPRWNPGENRSH